MILKVLFALVVALLLPVVPSLAQTKVFYGDSITVQAGYPWVVADHAGASDFLRPAANGHTANAQADAIYNRTIVSGDEFFYMLGTNDRKLYGASSGALDLYRNAVSAGIYWLAGNKKLPNSSDWTWTGSGWAPSAQFGGTFSMATAQAGDYGEATFTGDVALLSYIVVDSLGSWSFEVKIDGVSKGTFSLAPPTTINVTGVVPAGRIYSPALLRFTGLGSGAHTLRVTAVSGGVGINWLGTGPNGNAVRVLTQTRTVGMYSGDSDSHTAAYNSVLSDVVSQAAGDGYDVTLIDTHSVVDPATDLIDGVHPNIGGQIKMKVKILQDLGL